MNVQHNLIQELILYKFKMSHNIAEAIKKLKALLITSVTRRFKKFYLDWKNLNNQARSDKLKLDSKDILQAREANLVNCTKYQSGVGWLLIVWVLWHINHCRLFNAKSIFIEIISSISNKSV